ncbi:hypothetical protein Salat_0669300 [Sesamum alatum]|uniref:Uncharacterized protein n=1 Tax=Sesamum alatum TaxID=300844 RepID=A0AAE1YQZ4_9LAMI|nr:hypothetical protein Salat_0669300 [Sesamum alatum]
MEGDRLHTKGRWRMEKVSEREEKRAKHRAVGEKRKGFDLGLGFAGLNKDNSVGSGDFSGLPGFRSLGHPWSVGPVISDSGHGPTSTKSTFKSLSIIGCGKILLSIS